MKNQVDISFLGLGPIAQMRGDLAGAGTYPSRQRRWRDYRFAVRQDARRATASQSGEMKGEAPLLHFTRHRNVDRLLNR